MKKTLITLSAVVAAMFAAQGVMAQDKARADVKAEAKDAVKAGKVEKGEGSTSPTAGAKSTQARADVKKEAAAADKSAGKGEGPAAAASGAKSTKARAEVKKEAAAAVKAGEVGKGPDVKK